MASDRRRLRMVVTTLACLEGDWKQGRESSDRGLEMSPLNPQLLEPRVLSEYETGEFGRGWGEILVSLLLKELTDSAGDIQFGEGQERELKGLSGLNRVYLVDRS